jgi:hypothetical protein
MSELGRAVLALLRRILNTHECKVDACPTKFLFGIGAGMRHPGCELKPVSPQPFHTNETQNSYPL